MYKYTQSKFSIISFSLKASLLTSDTLMIITYFETDLKWFIFLLILFGRASAELNYAQQIFNRSFQFGFPNWQAHHL